MRGRQCQRCTWAVRGEWATAWHWFRRDQTSVGPKIHNDWIALRWWETYETHHPEIADMARRRRCVRALSATSERAFS